MLFFALAAAAPLHCTPFDHQYRDLAAFYDGAVSSAGVDYPALIEKRPQLDKALECIESAPLETFSSKEQRLALYVNAYNAYTVAMILDHYPVASIKDLYGGEPWKTPTFSVGGETLTLDQMEHERARKLADGRVHAVLNCASKGCPPLPPEPMRGKNTDTQLTAAAKAWVESNAWTDLGDGKIGIARIFLWFPSDFPSCDWWSIVDPKSRALCFLKQYVPADTAAGWRENTPSVEWTPYDWSLNAQ